MRIAHVTSSFPPQVGGASLVSYAHASGLARRGHDVTVITPDRLAHEIDDSCNMTVRRFKPLAQVGNAPVIPQLATLNGYDLIHLHFPFHFGAEMAAWAASQARVPLIISYHGDGVLHGIPGITGEMQNHNLGAWALRNASCITFPSLDYAMNSHVRWLLDDDAPVFELPYGIDISRFMPDPLGAARLRDRYRVRDEEIIVTLVASLDRTHYFKGVNTLLHALQYLNDLPLRVWIVGDGDLREAYEQQADQLGVFERVHFHGSVPNNELPAYYCAGDITVLPSTSLESFGITLIESMACARPVIASSLPGVRTVVDDGFDGLLFAPGDSEALAEKIRVLAGDPSLRAEYGLNGRLKAASHYDWSGIIDTLELIYSHIRERQVA